jgi:hypothetical protein
VFSLRHKGALSIFYNLLASVPTPYKIYSSYSL